jgi:hypothetical protein
MKSRDQWEVAGMVMGILGEFLSSGAYIYTKLYKVMGRARDIQRTEGSPD